MNIAWNMRREHLPVTQRSHYVITNGGGSAQRRAGRGGGLVLLPRTDVQADPGPLRARQHDLRSRRDGTGTTVTRQVLGYAAPNYGNRPLAEAAHQNMVRVGMPKWTADDQAFARQVQEANGFKLQPLRPRSRRSRPRKAAGPRTAAAPTTSAISCGRCRPSPCAIRRTCRTRRATTSRRPWRWRRRSRTRARRSARKALALTILDIATTPSNGRQCEGLLQGRADQGRRNMRRCLSPATSPPSISTRN
jgi:hypothetical protein